MKAIKPDTCQEILRLSIPLFAARGYDGVSMREIAEAASVTPAALYYHFKDKDQLYQDALDFCFKDKIGAKLIDSLPKGGDPWARLEFLVKKWNDILAKEVEFHRLVQRVYLDPDPERQALVGKRVLGDFYEAIRQTVAQIAPQYDEHQLALSLVALVSYPYQTAPIRRDLPGYRARNETPAQRTKHILALFRQIVQAPQGK